MAREIAIYIAICLGAVAVGWLLSGCAESRCYEQVAINPTKGYAIVFNACTGKFLVQVDESITTPTTTTTLPSF